MLCIRSDLYRLKNASPLRPPPSCQRMWECVSWMRQDFFPKISKLSSSVVHFKCIMQTMPILNVHVDLSPTVFCNFWGSREIFVPGRGRERKDGCSLCLGVIFWDYPMPHCHILGIPLHIHTFSKLPLVNFRSRCDGSTFHKGITLKKKYTIGLIWMKRQRLDEMRR